MKHTTKSGRLLLAILLVSFVVAVTGCSNDDPVTPHDQLTWTPDDVAVQVGYLVYAMVRVLPELSNKALLPGLDSLGAPFSGDFWSDTNPNHVWTDADHFLVWTPAGYSGVDFIATFDIIASNGLANGSGALTVAPLVVSFEIDGVQIVASGYPQAGQMLIDTSGWTATVTFTPTGATVAVNGRTWNIDMSDGTVTEI